MHITEERVDAACEAMARTIAKQDGVELAKAGYEHGIKERPEEHAQMREYVRAALTAAFPVPEAGADKKLASAIAICRSNAEAMIAQNTQWRLDPRYILTLCDALVARSPAGTEPATIEREWQSLLEKDDRTSPDEYPDMALITLEELREIVSAASPPPAPAPAPAPAVVVKALEWTPVALVDGYNWLTIAQADTPFGRYTIDKHDKGFLRVMFGNRRIGHFEHADSEAAKAAAKAAAQADYEARIRSALVDAPAAPRALPDGWVAVPREPLPEMLGAWYRVKNGHHFHDEPAPTNRSDYAAYRAMIAAAPSISAEEA